MQISLNAINKKNIIIVLMMQMNHNTMDQCKVDTTTSATKNPL
jgi:hypothetical protein